MGFIAKSQVSAETNITNESFYPDLDVVKFREVMRLEGNVTAERLNDALLTSAFRVNADLVEWQEEKRIAGFSLLADVPCSVIGEQSLYVFQYQHAVQCFAKADLVERFQDYDNSLNGAQRAEEMNAMIDDYRRQGLQAVKRILGKPLVTVELI
jgi:hypothetical protein